MQPLATSLVGGILPFGAVPAAQSTPLPREGKCQCILASRFTELFFIMSSIWLHECAPEPEGDVPLV